MIYLVRPAVITAMRSTWWPALRRYMAPPILRAVDNDEPMDFLTEIRHVVVVFLNIITRTVTEDVLIEVVNNAFKIVCCVTSKTGGLVNKVSMFDKDMMFLMVFGLRGLKHEDEAQNALLCANKLKEHLNDVNITTVSVGVTSGSTYCGVVGHALRREYTVIGSAVNKAARLMIAYPNKVTCDKETFLRSKLDQDFFKLMEAKILKGFTNPGPIYEFNRSSTKRVSYSHPILGRDEELQVYLSTLRKAIDEYSKKFTRYRDHKFAVALVGSRLAGKSRLMAECLNITPKFVEIDQIILTENDNVPYQLLRLIMGRLFKGIARSSRENRESRIRFTVDMTSLRPLEIYAINTIFDCRFPLPESFQYDDSKDLLKEYQVRILMQNIFEASFKQLRVVAVAEAQHIDDESWKVLLLILQYKICFVLLTVTDEEKLSHVGRSALSNHMIVKLQISGIDRRYLAALACQLLDVQAIPSELDKVIESASDGLPGWIQNFLICLVQREQLTMVTVPRTQALDTGALTPPTSLLKKPDGKTSISSESFSKPDKGCDASTGEDRQSDIIQMAVLSKYYNFDDVKVDMKMDVLILKTYDSLTPFEKMLLKCSSVLGDVFSRRMLLHLLQCESPRKVAEAVAKLFSIRVLECEGGDFTRDHSRVLINPAPVCKEYVLPFCFCLGTKRLNDCDDLPAFAFCGYMKFRHTLFRSTTYDLLTDCQKREMHSRALLYLERFTRKCSSCGSGCFSRLFGLRCDDGLKKETEDLKQTREQIRTLNAESKVSEGNIYSALGNINECGELKEEHNAALAAKWSLNYAIKADSNFRLLCTSYGNVINIYRQQQKFRLCRRFENKARELCNRKRGHVDLMEAHAVGHLYTNIFLYNVQRGNKMESLEFGLSVMRIMTDLSDITTRESLNFWILKLLLTELRIHQMVSIMKEVMYQEHIDVSTEVWYHFYSMSIFLDTGYCVESYKTCETFYVQKGDLFLRSKTPEAGWNFYACMWLFTIRVGMWEKSVIWNDKIEEIQKMESTIHEYYTSMMLMVVEGYMIDLVRELNNKNIKKVLYIAKTLKTLMPKLVVSCKHYPIFQSRYYLLNGYYNFIRHKKQCAYNSLKKALQIAKKYSDRLMIIWIEHNKQNWKRSLNPRLENYWSEHVESDTVLNYKTYEVEKEN
ncbi:adenylate cyclase type 10-like isoform X12 [Pieris napi]|uniref:adenylate cyclase type 10-like isoform X12 n=1 Tax=Pieris napi TaxID=78633 RepID=UPI001FB91FE7|nr:adenylate cyclase type 10-like isoform X12 [Pieris napi]